MSDLRVKLILEAVDRISGQMARISTAFTRSTERMRASLSRVADSMTQVGANLTLRLSAPLAGLGTLAVRQSASFEKLRASLKTVTGSTQAAQTAFDDLIRFSATTPYQLEEVMGAFIKLKALGLDPSMTALKSYGNTASAMGKGLDQFIEAVADAATGEFERLKEFGIRAEQNGNRVAFTFRGQRTIVRKSAAEIETYLRRIGEIEFAGAMEEQMATLGGAFSNLQDAVSSSLARVGDKISQTLALREFTKRLSDAVSGLADAFLRLPAPIQSFLIKGGLIAALLGPLIIGVGQFALGLSFMILGFSKLAPLLTLISALTTRLLIPAFVAALGAVKAFGIALLTTPVGWILLGLTALAGAAYLIIKNWESVSGFFSSMWEEIKGIFSRSVDLVLELLQPLFDAVDRIGAGLAKVRGWATDNALTRGIGSLLADEPSTRIPTSAGGVRLGPAAPLSGGVLRNKVDAGGTLRIRIDSDGQARAVQSQPNDPRIGYSVETGLLMGGF